MKISYLLLITTLTFANSFLAEANEKNIIGNWITYIGKKGNKNICYVYSNPVNENNEKNADKNEKRTAYVSINYLGDDRYTFSYSPGFMIDKNKTVAITIANKTIDLDNNFGSFAPTYSAEQDVYIVDTLIKETNYQPSFTMSSYPNRSQVATMDIFSVNGLVDALSYLAKNCK